MEKMKVLAPLDPAFEPIYRGLEAFAARAAEGPEIRIAVERNDGLVATHDMRILPEGEDDALSLRMVERMVKSMLWVYGGFRVTIAGSKAVYEGVKAQYCEGGARAFDANFMAHVYEHPFEVCYAATPAEAPARKDASAPIGRHLDGCRIGFDAGGSDRKVSAVINGESVYSEEVVWFPKTQSDPAYHFDGIVSAMKTAASKMPRVDAIGVSSAGVYINNHTMSASLFLKVGPEDYEKYVKDIYIRAAKEIGDVPLTVCNDGDVTALAGAMSLGEDGILGIAMGTSEAGGYVDMKGNITGWLNELAFVPCDLALGAMVDEWSGDIGCGVKYFSQDAVIKLAPAAGIELDPALSPAEKLKVVQAKMEQGDAGARAIYETIGVYLGYTLAFYAMFYDINHVLLMGRVTSGEGGDLVLGKAQEVLRAEYPELRMQVNLPDEKSRRVGQSVAAASLPQIG
ncbi:MAG TPA: ROK family protein [Candidatus Limiplasma pullistercoris]|nr:ROK family protein [Candidatus Limiplasma pullistercoris]